MGMSDPLEEIEMFEKRIGVLEVIVCAFSSGHLDY